MTPILKRIRRDVVISVVDGRDFVGICFEDDPTKTLMECSPDDATVLVAIWNGIVKLTEDRLHDDYIQDQADRLKEQCQ